MDVLFLTAEPPWPTRSGGRLRTYELLRAIRERVRVHLWTVVEARVSAECERALAEVCASVRFFPRSPAPALARALRAKTERWFHSREVVRALAEPHALAHFDLVHLDELCLWRALPIAPAPPLVVHHHKLDRELARALHAPAWERAKLARLERASAARASTHVVCSREDAERLRLRHPALDLHVVESGVDPTYFAPRSLPRDPETLLFLGSLAYAPNLDGLEHFIAHIWPRVRAARPDVRLRIVGERPTLRARTLAAPGLELIGELDDIRPELARATALIAPLRIGGGTRLKIVCALACECPVVATRVAAEGLGLRHDEHLLLADEPAAFAQSLLELCADPSRARALAHAGRERVLALYTWEQLAHKLLASWQAATTDRQPATVVVGTSSARPKRAY